MQIGVVPARAGSIRLPGKNRQLLGGVPLWLRAAFKAKRHMDRVYVNTDDEEIIENSNGFEIYLRPQDLRDGRSYRVDDVLIEMAKNLGWHDRDVVHLFQCTNPFIKDETIEKVKAMDSVNLSVQAIHRISNIYHEYSHRYVDGEIVQFCKPRLRNKFFNSQKKPLTYAFSGYVAVPVVCLLVENKIFTKYSRFVETTALEAFDIDTQEDLYVAGAIVASGLAV